MGRVVEGGGGWRFSIRKIFLSVSCCTSKYLMTTFPLPSSPAAFSMSPLMSTKEDVSVIFKKTYYFSQGYAAEASKLIVSVAELGSTLVAREYTGLKIAGEDDIWTLLCTDFAKYSLGLYSETGFLIGMDRYFVCLWRRSQIINLSLSALISWFIKSIIIIYMQ